MTATRGHIEDLVVRIQTAYLEHPTLSLTLPAAQRQFGLDEFTCAGVLGALVNAGVLSRRNGSYRREFPRPPLDERPEAALAPGLWRKTTNANRSAADA